MAGLIDVLKGAGGMVKGAGGLATKVGTGAIGTGARAINLGAKGMGIADQGFAALIRMLVKGGRNILPKGVSNNATWKKLVAALRQAANSSAVRKTALGVGGLGGLSALLSSMPDESQQMEDPTAGLSQGGYDPYQGMGSSY